MSRSRVAFMPSFARCSQRTAPAARNARAARTSVSPADASKARWWCCRCSTTRSALGTTTALAEAAQSARGLGRFGVVVGEYERQVRRAHAVRDDRGGGSRATTARRGSDEGKTSHDGSCSLTLQLRDVTSRMCDSQSFSLPALREIFPALRPSL